MRTSVEYTPMTTKTGKTTAVDYKTERDGDEIINILPTDKPDEFYLVGNFALFRLDAKSGEIKKVLDSINTLLLDTPDGRTFYSANASVSPYLNLSSFNLDNMETKTTCTIGLISIYIIYEISNRALCVFSPEQNSSGGDLTILCSSPRTNESPYVNEDSMNMRVMNVQFEKDYDAAVNTIKYDQEWNVRIYGQRSILLKRQVSR